MAVRQVTATDGPIMGPGSERHTATWHVCICVALQPNVHKYMYTHVCMKYTHIRTCTRLFKPWLPKINQLCYCTYFLHLHCSRLCVSSTHCIYTHFTLHTAHFKPYTMHISNHTHCTFQTTHTAHFKPHTLHITSNTLHTAQYPSHTWSHSFTNPLPRGPPHSGPTVAAASNSPASAGRGGECASLSPWRTRTLS